MNAKYELRNFMEHHQLNADDLEELAREIEDEEAEK